MEHPPQKQSLSEAMQMYLKIIHGIQEQKGAARVTDIAQKAGVSKGSVSVALKNLAERKLVNYAPYDVITLTQQGLEIAREVEQRFSVLFSFLNQVLGLPADQADREACDLEHHISESLSERLIGFIQYYQQCSSVKFRWNPEINNFCEDPDLD